MFEPSAERTGWSKGEQQQPTRDDRRQYERQMDKAVKQGLARKPLAREQPGETEGERQTGRHGHAADLERQKDDLPIFGGQPVHLAAGVKP